MGRLVEGWMGGWEKIFADQRDNVQVIGVD
jgi:hypothetical protein